MARYALVVARFYEELAQRLESGARAQLEAHGDSVEVFDVHGAFELAAAALYVADSGRFDGVVCLGAVIRGETDHYDYVCATAAHGIQKVGLATGVPCSFGVLTVDNYEQALARSGGDRRDSGAHAAAAVLQLAGIRAALKSPVASSGARSPGDAGGAQALD
jgi:6,7-dimethyl-8-ribityllumazine synthase